MFNNELMADVHFIVGRPGESQKVPAHKVNVAYLILDFKKKSHKILSVWVMYLFFLNSVLCSFSMYWQWGVLCLVPCFTGILLRANLKFIFLMWSLLLF